MLHQVVELLVDTESEGIWKVVVTEWLRYNPGISQKGPQSEE
jgi:hypothetical protein